MSIWADLVSLKTSLSAQSTRGFKTAVVSVNTRHFSNASRFQNLKHQHPDRSGAENNRPLLGREAKAIETVQNARQRFR